MTSYLYTKSPVSVDRLTQEIQQSTIVTALDHIDVSGDQVTIWFKADLSTDDKTTLDGIVAAHTGTPLPQNVAAPVAVQTLPDPVPFAQPLYRTKDDAVADLVTCPINQATNIDYLLTQELYTYGGELVVENAEFGDWVSAEVYDVDGVIPDAPYPPNPAITYRQALCEAWPSVAKYIIKRYVYNGGLISVMSIDTRPLIAKITAGLYLRITYNAINSGSPRILTANYFMVKKL